MYVYLWLITAFGCVVINTLLFGSQSQEDINRTAAFTFGIAILNVLTDLINAIKNKH